MARVIFISPYIKGGNTSRKSNLVHYVATRDGVELLTDDTRKLAPTKKQKEYIARLLRGFPQGKEMFEYEDYLSNPTRETASELIDQMYEQFVEPLDKKENFIDYVANRPGAKKVGEHGLWSWDGKVPVLAQTMREVSEYEGNVWTPVVSIRREDAERLGYTDAEQWRTLVCSIAPEIAAGYKIQLDHLRWYAALHEKEKGYHIHMVIFSDNPKEGYLTKKGIRDIRSAFTTHIFEQDLLCIYKRQTEARNALQSDTQKQMQNLIYQMEHGELRNEKLEQLIIKLSERLQETKGRKVYGYLPPRVKRIVDEIVDELAKDERVAKAYDLWQQMRDEVCRSYGEPLPDRMPLSHQKEFKPVRNMVIREALNLSAIAQGYEDGYLSDRPEEDEAPEQDDAMDYGYTEKKYSYTVYEQAMRYRRARRVLKDEASSITDVLEARDLLETLWEEGYTVAAHQLGKLYRDGISTIPNKETAAMWFRRSAEAGNDFSQYALGKLLLEERDKREAVRWLEKAAEAGNQHARYRVGKLYLEGAVMKKDVAKAIEYLTASAKQGNQYAQYTLGKLYLLGKDVTQDKDAATEWLTLTAQQGNPYAKFFLTRIDNPYGTDAWVATLRMMHHMGNIFRDNTDRGGAYINLLQIDRKRRKELQRKRKALGHHVKDHEEHAPMQQYI